MKNVLLLIFVEIIFGCNYSQPIARQTFSGQVIDYSTGLPIANANVQLIRATESYHPVFYLSDLRNQTYDFTTTDASGNFRFYLPTSNSSVYRLIPSMSNYIFADTCLNLVQPLSGSTTEYFNTLLLDQPSFLQVNFHDTIISSINDTLFLVEGFGNYLPSINTYWRPHFHKAIISNNSVVQFFDSVSYKQNKYSKIVIEIVQHGLTVPPRDITIELTPFGNKIIDLYY